MLLGLELKQAAVLSQAVIAAGALAGVLYGSRRQHPAQAGKPLVDFALCIILLPPLLCGVSMGVLLNSIVPNWLITVVLDVLLAYLTFKTLRKAAALHRTEQALLKAQQATLPSPAPARASSPGTEPATPASSLPPALAARLQAGPVKSLTRQPPQGLADGLPDTPRSCFSVSCGTPPGQQGDSPASGQQPAHPFAWQRQASDDDELGPTVPLIQPVPVADTPPQGRLRSGTALYAAGLLLLWLAFMVAQVAKEQLDRCSLEWLATYGGQALVSVAVAAIFIVVEGRRAQRSAAAVADPLLAPAIDRQPALPASQLVFCAAVTLVGGAMAGLLGIGGGMILGPLLLELHLHPLVVAATSSLMVLFSSSAATLSYAAGGRLDVAAAALYGGLACAGSLAGVTLVGRAVQRSGRASIVVFILAAIIGTGGALGGVFGGAQALADLAARRHLGFQALCG